MPSIKVDITPYISLLFNDVTNRIGFNISNDANPFWFVDGNLLIWTENQELDYDTPFTGKLDFIHASLNVPNVFINGDFDANITIYTDASRSIIASGKHCIRNKCMRSSVSKSIAFSNKLMFMNGGRRQFAVQNSEVNEIISYFEFRGLALMNGKVEMEHKNYPFNADIQATEFQNGSFIFYTDIEHGLEIRKYEIENAKFDMNLNSFSFTDPYSILETKQVSSGIFSDIMSRYGDTNQQFLFYSPNRCFSRNITSKKGLVIFDNINSEC